MKASSSEKRLAALKNTNFKRKLKEQAFFRLLFSIITVESADLPCYTFQPTADSLDSTNLR